VLQYGKTGAIWREGNGVANDSERKRSEDGGVDEGIDRLVVGQVNIDERSMSMTRWTYCKPLR